MLDFISKMYTNSGSLVENWYALGQPREFRKNVPLAKEILETPIVTWKKEDGSYTTILDRCNHRNAPLSKGKIVNQCIVCPYHGWAYNDEGQCVEIPSEGPHTERIPNKRVHQFPTKESNGLIWVWMGKSGEPSKEPYSMPVMSEHGWNYYYMVTPFKNNVTDLVENFMDVPHTVFVHKGWFRDRKQVRVEAKVERTEDSVLVTYDQPNDSIGFSNWLINPKNLPMFHTDNFYMPNNTRVDYIYGKNERGFIISSTCTPISPFKTMVYTLISYKFGWMTPLARLGLPFYTRQVINQDVWIMDMHGEHLKKFNETPDYRSTQCDFMHLYIESLRNHAENPEQHKKPNPIVKDIEFWI